MDKAEFERQIGRNIREARLAAGFTQEQLAEKVDISSSFLSRVENGASMPAVSTIGEIAEKLGIRPERLLLTEVQQSGYDEYDSQLLYLISQSTRREKRHLCKYITLLRELRSDK